MKTNQTVKPIISEDGMRVTFEVRGHEAIVLDMTKLHPSIVARAAAVGMAQVRIVDAAAISRQDSDGNIRTDEEMADLKHAAMKELVAHYMTGTDQWGMRAAGGGGAKSEGSLIIRAVAAVQGVSPETMREKLEALAEKRQTTVRKLLNALATQDAVAREMAKLRAAATSAVDVNGLLDELSE